MQTSNSAPPFHVEGRRHDLVFRRARLTEREWLSPSYVRVRLTGPDLRGFVSEGADDHIRLFFPDGPVETRDELRAAPSREYTPLAWDADAGVLDVEFAVHGDEGLAAPWAANAPLGSGIGVGGPRGSRVLVGAPDAWFLAGDETAVPAIRRFAAGMADDAAGDIVVEVTDAAHELEIAAPRGVRIRFVHRGANAAGSALIAHLEALRADDRPSGAVYGFVAAEQSVVRPARALLLDRWSLEPDTVSIRGYWKRGDAEYHAPH